MRFWGVLAMLPVGLGALAATVEVDFSAGAGRFNPLLHGSGFAPRLRATASRGDGFTDNETRAIKAMNLAAVRLHDHALVNPGARIVDTHFIFPLLHLDPANPSNYFFGATDDYLSRIRDRTGMKILYRLGSSIENAGTKGWNTLNPPDHARYAEVLAGIVRHYTRGWAGGFTWEIDYWELFNEPDIRECWRGTEEEFNDLFIVCFKRLKREFPELKIGGPAFSGWWSRKQIERFLRRCREEGCKLDFFSYHRYGQQPLDFASESRDVRATLDRLGFAGCELILDEWHYLRSWDDYRGAPEVRRKAAESDWGFTGIDSAVFTVATLAALQGSAVDQAYFYGGGPTGALGYLDEHEGMNKVGLALTMFGEVAGGATERLRATSAERAVIPFAARSADGRAAWLIVADYRSGAARPLSVALRGLNGLKPVAALALDRERDNATCAFNYEAGAAGGTLTLEKRGTASAAFLVRLVKE